jgi:hypothetical protein
VRAGRRSPNAAAPEAGEDLRRPSRRTFAAARPGRIQPAHGGLGAHGGRDRAGERKVVLRNQRGGRSRGEGTKRGASNPLPPAQTGRQPLAGVGAASTQAHSSPTEERGGTEGAGAGSVGVRPQFGPWHGACCGREWFAVRFETGPPSKGNAGVPSEGRCVAQSAAARDAGKHAASATASAVPINHARLACDIVASGDCLDCREGTMVYLYRESP